MNDFELKRLMEIADRTADLARVLPPDWTVLERLARRRRVARASRLAAAAVMCVLACGWLARGVPREPRPPRTQPAQDALAHGGRQAEPNHEENGASGIAEQGPTSLSREAAARQRLAEQAGQQRRLASQLRQLRLLQQQRCRSKWLDDQDQRAAAAVLYYARQLDTNFGQPEAAAAQYRHVIQWFPHTPCAESARKWLARRNDNS